MFNLPAHSSFAPSPDISLKTVLDERVPLGIRFLAPDLDLNHFCSELGVQGFQILSKDIPRSVCGEIDPSIRTSACSYFHVGSPLLLQYRDGYCLSKGRVVAQERECRVTDVSPDPRCPTLLFSSTPSTGPFPPSYEVSAIINEDSRQWNNPTFASACKAAKIPTPLYDAMNKSELAANGSLIEMKVSPTRMIIAGIPLVYRPVGVPVLDGDFLISRIQIAEPSPLEIHELFHLLGGKACSESVIRSGLLSYGASLLQDSRVRDIDTLGEISAKLHQLGESAVISHFSSGTVGRAELSAVSPSKIGQHCEGVEFSLRSPINLPCKVAVTSNLLTTRNPICFDRSPIENTLNAITLEFTCADLCTGPLANFHTDLCGQFNIPVGNTVWRRVADWIYSDSTPDVTRGYEVQLGGRLNLTLEPAPRQ